MAAYNRDDSPAIDPAIDVDDILDVIEMAIDKQYPRNRLVYVELPRELSVAEFRSIKARLARQDWLMRYSYFQFFFGKKLVLAPDSDYGDD